MFQVRVVGIRMAQVESVLGQLEEKMALGEQREPGRRCVLIPPLIGKTILTFRDGE